MTPFVAAASPTVVPSAPIGIVSTAVHDREWWPEEAVRAGTDWFGVSTPRPEPPISIEVHLPRHRRCWHDILHIGLTAARTERRLPTMWLSVRLVVERSG